MEPCVHNVISLCRHFLGVDFAKEDVSKPMWKRLCDTNHEAFNHDVSAEAQPHLTAAMNQLSRAGFMDLQARVMPPKGSFGTSYSVDVIFEVNGRGAWNWVLSRKLVQVPVGVCRDLGGCEEGDGVQGNARVVTVRTSWHSHIDAY